MRALSDGAILTFLYGSGNQNLLPPEQLPISAGDQPASDKVQGFPPLLGFRIEIGIDPALDQLG